MEKLRERDIAHRDSVANYAFFLGASNENLERLNLPTPQGLPG